LHLRKQLIGEEISSPNLHQLMEHNQILVASGQSPVGDFAGNWRLLFYWAFGLEAGISAK
jgi:hypothetical protein